MDALAQRSALQSRHTIRPVYRDGQDASSHVLCAIDGVRLVRRIDQLVHDPVDMRRVVMTPLVASWPRA